MVVSLHTAVASDISLTGAELFLRNEICQDVREYLVRDLLDGHRFVKIQVNRSTGQIEEVLTGVVKEVNGKGEVVVSGYEKFPNLVVGEIDDIEELTLQNIARRVNTAENFTEYIRNGFKINASTLDDAFKHFDDFVPNGVGKPTFNNVKLVGCHNEVNFNKQLVSNGGKIEKVNSTPSGVNGVKNIEYKTLQLDVQGNPIPGQYVGNGTTHIKTVYDPTIFPEASMKDLGYKAFKDAMDNNKFDLTDPNTGNQLFRTFEGNANGRTISGYYKEVNGEKIISTWWIKN